jgi:hypothetical protein
VRLPGTRFTSAISCFEPGLQEPCGDIFVETHCETQGTQHFMVVFFRSLPNFPWSENVGQQCFDWLFMDNWFKIIVKSLWLILSFCHEPKSENLSMFPAEHISITKLIQTKY